MSGTDLYNDQLAVETIDIATRTNGTVNGATVDLSQSGACFQKALVLVLSGTMTDGSVAVTVQESDDDSAWAAVADEDLQGTEPTIAAANDNVLYQIGYIGMKRYLRVVAVTTGATSGGTFGAVVVLADPRVKPVVHS